MLDASVRFFDLDAVVVDERQLSGSERERVARKATPGLRQRQAASFQCLRVTLGEVLGLAPIAVPIGIAEGGKPCLVNDDARGLHFNLSHSGGVGMLAWGPRELGADVEALIARPSDGLAEEILTPRELSVWRTLPGDAQRPWLTRAWVRKEAALKAVGSGLRIAPRTVDVGGGDDAEGSTWKLQLDDRAWQGFDILDAVPDGYRAAVVIEAAPKPWFVYVIRCAGDRLYCGIATDVDDRIEAHRSGKGAKFTRAFAPEALLATMRTASRSEALREEAAFKALTRGGKLARIAAWQGAGN